MNRREILKLLAAMGITAGMPISVARAATCSSPKYFVSVFVKGGWDTTMFCDPKGNHLSVDGNTPINYFNPDLIRGKHGKIGNGYRADTPFSWAPPSAVSSLQDGFDTEELYERYFIDMANEHGMVLINGMDAMTNSHTIGRRNIFSGNQASGYPTIAALYAAILNKNIAMPFVTFGGYDETSSLIALSRIGDPSFFEDITDHAVSNLTDDENALMQAVALKQNRRYAMSSIGHQRRQTVQKFIDSKTSDSSVANLLKMAPKYTSNDPLLQTVENQLPLGTEDGYLHSDMDILQAELLATAFSSGLSVTGNLYLSSADSHRDNDTRQLEIQCKYIRAVDRFWKTAKKMDDAYGSSMTDHTTMYSASEFSRTPWYNKDNGKDHWPTTTVMLSGAGVRGQQKVIGASDDGFLPINVDPTTLVLDPSKSNPNSLRMTSPMLHQAIRNQLLCIDDHALIQRFKFDSSLPELPLFTS